LKGEKSNTAQTKQPEPISNSATVASYVPFYTDDNIVLYNNDYRNVIDSLAPADLIIADPPYGEKQASWDDEKPDIEVWRAFYDKLKDGGVLYYWGFWGHAEWILKNARRAGFTEQSRIVWWFATGRPEKKSYREDTEDCYYFSKGEPNYFNPNNYYEPYDKVSNYERYNKNGKHPGTIWRASRIMWNHPENVGHETQKPLTLYKKIIDISCPPNGIVYDFFCGSGTTLLAAKQLGRKAVGVEKEEKYCDMIMKRLSQTEMQL